MNVDLFDDDSIELDLDLDPVDVLPQPFKVPAPSLVIGDDHYTIVQDPCQRKKKSCVWRFFGALHKNGTAFDEKHIYCTKCFDQSKTKKYQRSTATGNLIKHLKRAHNVPEHTSYRIRLDRDRCTVTQRDDAAFLDTDDGDADELPTSGTFSVVEPSSAGSRTLITDNNNEIQPIVVSPSDGDTREYYVKDINEILIYEVAKRPQLYEPSLYKSKSIVRSQLWLEIYEALNHLIPYEKIPKIWKNIRDRYQKVKRCIKRNGGQKMPRYRYYDKLHFLDDVDDSANASDETKEPKSAEQNAADEHTAKRESADDFVSEFIFMNVDPPVQLLSDDRKGAALQPPKADQPLSVVDLDIDANCSEIDDIDDEYVEDEDDDDEDEYVDDEDVDDDDVVCDVDDIFGPPTNVNGRHPAQFVALSVRDLTLTDSSEADDVVEAPAQPLSPEPNSKKQKLEANAVGCASNGTAVVHGELMTPDNIASFLVEQHQNEMLCHQQQQLSGNGPASASIISEARLSVVAAGQPAMSRTITVMLPADDERSSGISTTPFDADDDALLASVAEFSVQLRGSGADADFADAAESAVAVETEEFTLFGNYVAEVLRNMDRTKARLLQMQVMHLIAECNDETAMTCGPWTTGDDAV